MAAGYGPRGDHLRAARDHNVLKAAVLLAGGDDATMQRCLDEVNRTLHDSPTWREIGPFTRAGLVGVIVAAWQRAQEPPRG